MHLHQQLGDDLMRELLPILALVLFLVWDISQNQGRAIGSAFAMIGYLTRQLGID